MLSDVLLFLSIDPRLDVTLECNKSVDGGQTFTFTFIYSYVFICVKNYIISTRNNYDHHL